jgi:hypothetical protein
MAPKKKLIYLWGLFGVFVIAIPSLILYSSGYRLDNRFHLVKTGGIYLVNKESDAIVKLDGKRIKKAGMFERNILIRDLMPKRYYVTVEKDGYRAWKKKIEVEEQKVQICYPLLIPIELNPQLVPKYLIRSEEKGTKKREVNEEYLEAMKLFNTYGKPAERVMPAHEDNDVTKHNFNADRRLNRKVFLFRQENKLYVKWTGMDKKRPFFIDSSGKNPAFFPHKNILSFEFFPGRYDSMLVLLENLNLYVVEIDRRFDIHNAYKIVSNCSSFAVKDEILYYFSGGDMYRIDFDQTPQHR